MGCRCYIEAMPKKRVSKRPTPSQLDSVKEQTNRLPMTKSARKATAKMGVVKTQDAKGNPVAPRIQIEIVPIEQVPVETPAKRKTREKTSLRDTRWLLPCRPENAYY